MNKQMNKPNTGNHNNPTLTSLNRPTRAFHTTTLCDSSIRPKWNARRNAFNTAEIKTTSLTKNIITR